MHGIIRPVPAPSPAANVWFHARRQLARLRPWRGLLLFVMLPMVLLAAYYYLVAADQYQSEAHFTVSQGSSPSVAPSGFGELVGLSASTQSQAASLSVADFLRSHDAVAQLRAALPLVDLFRRPEADVIARLGDPNPSAETLLKAYRGWVTVYYDRDSGLTNLRVRTFRAADSYRLAEALLVLGERRVNEMNRRRYADAVSSARARLADAETAVARTQRTITAFRQDRGDIDPQSSGSAQLRIVSDVKGQLIAARAKLATTARVVGTRSPQYAALAEQVRSLEQAVGAQSQQLAGGRSAIASDLGGYEDLRLRQDFVGKSYSAAAASVEKAREEARQQQLYLIRVVEPNRPDEALFPRRARILLTVLISLILIYSIGWLIAAGLREHAA